MKTIYDNTEHEVSFIDANDQNALFIKAFIDHEEGEKHCIHVKFNYFTEEKGLTSFNVFKKDLEDLLHAIYKMEERVKQQEKEE